MRRLFRWKMLYGKRKYNMNIAIIIPSMEIGGAERVALMLADHFCSLGNSVIFFFFNKYGKKYQCDYNYKYLNYELNSNTSQLKRLVSAASELKYYKNKYGIDISISFMEVANILNTISRVNDRVILSTRTTLSHRDELKGIVYNPVLIRIIYNCADRIVAVSNYTKNDLMDVFKINKKKVITIPNPAIVHENSVDEEWAYGENVVLHVGRMDPVKQQDRIIRAFSFVRQQIPNSKLIILGDGNIRGYLESIIRKMNMQEAVYLLGFQKNVGYYYKNSSVMVMSSRTEGFPNAIVEGMAYGLPIISTNSPGGCPEIIGKTEERIDGIDFCKYGILTPYIVGKASRNSGLDENEKKLGDAIVYLLRNKEVQLKYSKRSKIRARYYNKDRIMKLWDCVAET